MPRHLLRTAAALTVGVSTLLTPLAASADDWRRDRSGYGYGYYDRDYRHGYKKGYRDGHRYDRGYRYDHRRHHDDDDGDAVVAGVAGLAIGALIGSALSQPRHPAPPPRYAPPPRPYYDGYRTGYDGYRDGARLCVTREEVWDGYQRRYITVESSRYC